MREILLTKGRIAIVDDEDYDYLMQWKWFCTSTDNGRRGYAARRKDKANQHDTFIRMHNVILPPPDGMQVDHINRNTLDNRRENLRLCTGKQNSYNRTISCNNSSGIKGVHLGKQSKKWIAQIKHDGITYNLGSYSDIKDAEKAYLDKAKELFGEFYSSGEES